MATSMDKALARMHRSAREVLVRWVRGLPFPELIRLMQIAKPGGLGVRGDVAGAVRPSRRVLRQPERKLTSGEADIVRQRLGKLRPGMPGYEQARDRVCRQMRASRRQITACVVNAKWRDAAKRAGRKARRLKDAAKKRG